MCRSPYRIAAAVPLTRASLPSVLAHAAPGLSSACEQRRAQNDSLKAVSRAHHKASESASSDHAVQSASSPLPTSPSTHPARPTVPSHSPRPLYAEDDDFITDLFACNPGDDPSAGRKEEEMGRERQTASQFAGTEEALPADAFTPLPAAAPLSLQQPHTHSPSREQVSVALIRISRSEARLG